MPNKVNWDASPTFTSQITTGANSLADGASVLSAAIDNTTALDEYVAVRMSLASLNPSGTPYVEIHICPSYNASTYADIGAATLAATVPVTTGSSAKEVLLQRIEIPPLSYKIGILNRTGVAFASASNVVATGPYNDEIQ